MRVKSVIILSVLSVTFAFAVPGLTHAADKMAGFKSMPDSIPAPDSLRETAGGTGIVPEAHPGVAVFKGHNSISAADVALRKFLSDLRANPREVMNAEPPKYDANTGERLWLPEYDKKSAEFRTVRSVILRKRFSKHGGTKAMIARNDTPQDLFPPGAKVLADIAALPDSGAVKENPWTGYFWPVSAGGLANRYLDKNYSIPDQPADFNAAQEKDRREQINALYSPAEKYDLLMGDPNFTLTSAMITNRNKPGIPPWVGYCHGWAPASYMEKRPRKAQVEVLSADGKYTIRFYNNDIRGLAAVKWANSPTNVYLIGGRCEGNMLDDAGRPLDQNCFDTNPGTWHIAVANMIGIQRRSFIMDAASDLSVWNQPVLKYSFKYWNPLTEQFAPLTAARIPYDAFKNKDRFQKYRNPETAYLVGVEMKLSYVDDNNSTPDIDTDSVIEVVYRYDLELNSQGKVTGGEWYTNKHPDFLWTPVPGAKLLNAADISLSEKVRYDGSADSLKQITTNIDPGNASSLDQSPLYTVVEGLIELSQ
jgi:hypothetical protein